MAAKLRLQNNDQWVDICCSSGNYNHYCIDDSEFPGGQSGGGEPGEEFEN